MRRFELWITAISLLILSTTGCDNTDPKKYIDQAMEQLPAAREFIDDNTDLLELLIQVQTRVADYNNANADDCLEDIMLYPRQGRNGALSIYTDFIKSPTAINQEGITTFIVDTAIASKNDLEMINQYDNISLIGITASFIGIYFQSIGYNRGNVSIYICYSTNGAPQIETMQPIGNGWLYEARNYNSYDYIEFVNDLWYIEVINKRLN